MTEAIKVGRTVKVVSNGDESEITKIEDGIVTVNYAGKDNKIEIERLIEHVQCGMFEIV